MASPLKTIKKKRGPKPGTGGRPRKHPAGSAWLTVAIPPEAEEFLLRGEVEQGSPSAAVAYALRNTYPSPAEG